MGEGQEGEVAANGRNDWKRRALPGASSFLRASLKACLKIVLLVSLAFAPLVAQPAGRIHPRLIFAAETAPPGDTIFAGVELRMDPGWHTYWRNGGDSGGPPTIDWKLPKGVTAGEIQSSRDEYSEQSVRQQFSALGTYEQKAQNLSDIELNFNVSSDCGVTRMYAGSVRKRSRTANACLVASTHRCT